jgi:hypothetical protein
MTDTKHALLLGIANSAQKKIHMEFGIAFITKAPPNFVWIRDDVECLLDRYGMTLPEFMSWIRIHMVNNNIEIIFENN